MKFITAIFLVLFFFNSVAQKTEAYYDFYWKPCQPTEARFYSTLEKTDSGWLRHDYFIGNQQLQMKALYKDKDCKIKNGYATWYFANGNISMTGRIINDKQEGVCLSFHSNGMIADSASFHLGRPVGARMKWHRNGYPSDSIDHVNDSTDVQVSWFDDGAPAAAGYWVSGKKNGKWKYFHRNGNVAGIVVYDKDKEITQEYFNEDGSPEKNVAAANTEARFAKGGDEGWLKYLYKNLYWPRDLKFGSGSTATVGISFVVNEEGNVEDVMVSTPFHPEFDKIAVRIITESPKWQPAVDHNRKIKAYRLQPVTFTQEE